ncbi:MAG: hypothetical protein CMJ83_15800 [Planctomycetes bacterium]|nr:hypothetical protein [Planctomycetota bacterium]
MTSSLRLLCVLVLTGAVCAQDQTAYFSTRFTETPASGRAGDGNSFTAPCLPTPTFGIGFAIESALANSPGMSYVTPGAQNTTILNSPTATMTVDYVEVANFPQFNLYIGDLDADGLPHESGNFPGIDALHIVTPAVGRPNHMHEVFVSAYSDSSGSAGHIGSSILQSDMVLLPASSATYPNPSPPQTPVFFIRLADWQTFFNNSIATSFDVNAFTVDATNGDIYCSFDNSSITGCTVNTAPGNSAVVTLVRGDIVRIPGAAYTPSGPYGVVTAPQGGMAELVYTSANLDTMVNNAGGTISGTSTNCYGLSMDPSGGSTGTPTSGFMVANLYFTVDNRGGSLSGTQNMSAPAIYSNQAPAAVPTAFGLFAVMNGVTMDRPSSVGMSDPSFNQVPGFWCGPLDALAVVQHTPDLDPMADRPVHLDAFPTSGVITSSFYNGTLTGYVSGLPPGAVAAVMVGLTVVGNGSAVQRTNVSGFLPGYPDLYVDPFGLMNQDAVLAPAPLGPTGSPLEAAAMLIFNNAGGGMINPVAVWTDPVNNAQNGDTCFEIDMSGILPVGGSAPSLPPVLIVMQVLDLSTARLSDPMAFQLN